LKGIKTEQEANQYLPGFLKQINARYTVPAHQSDTVFRVSPRARELDRILCLKETRVVNSDHTLSYEGLIIQLPRSTKYASIAKQRVAKGRKRRSSIQKAGYSTLHSKSYGANAERETMRCIGRKHCPITY
jgi:hypothetical protein